MAGPARRESRIKPPGLQYQPISMDFKPMSSYQTILYEATDGIARLTLNRPEAMNGMTPDMLRETYEALLAAAADSSLRVLVITGAGRAFCPGADLKVMSGMKFGGYSPENLLRFRVPLLLHEMPAVSIAAINGACAGAGMGWACGADIRVAARSANFNTAFINVAVAGDMGLPWTLPRLVGAAKARELSFLADKFSAEEAQRIGLVARVWDDEKFHAELDAMVARLATRSPTALLALKTHYLAAERMGLGDYITMETEKHSRIRQLDDTVEAFRAFVEKRPPKFTGQ